MASLGSLTTGVAHELTSPLSIITSACSNLLYEMQDNTLDQQMLEQYVELIERNAFRSAHIVKVLHNYATMDKPRMAVTNASVIFRDSLTLVEHQFLKRGDAKIEVKLPEYLGSVVCDHNRITQVLVNLLSNANDAMKPQGGTIKVSFWTLPADESGQTSNGSQEIDKSGRFAFSVADSGHGIEPDIAGEIFKPFFTTRNGGERVGLGLFIAKGIVEQHNGQIRVENNPGTDKGAISTVILPVCPAP
jgi:signal transduction histidine kinase